MPAREPGGPRPGRRAGVLLGGVTALLLAGGAAPAAGTTQADARTSPLVEQFGGFDMSARGNGVQVTYDSPGVTPVSPAVQVGVPEALATSSSGTNYALASVAYPGPVLADLPTVLKQTNPDAPPVVPPYPVRTQAFFPSGPTEQAQAAGTSTMRSVTDAVSSQATVTSNATELEQLFQVAWVSAATRTRVEEGKVTTRARVEATGTDLLGGLLHIESIVTDLVAASDGRKAATDGRTTVNGVTFLGLAAELDGDGLRLSDEPPTADPPGALDPVIGELLGEDPSSLGESARPLADQLNDAITSTLGENATLGDLLEEHGVRIRVLEPVESISKGTGTRSANGVQMDLSYTASGDPRVAPLLKQLFPAGGLPAECPVPNAPLDCSPEGLVSLLTRTHIAAVVVAPAGVKAAATEPFEAVEVPFTPAPSVAGGGVPGGAGATGALPEPGFTTPMPSLPGGGGGLTPGSVLAALGRALPAALVLVLALTAPLWAAASRRLADAALAAGAAGCPDERAPGGGAG